MNEQYRDESEILESEGRAAFDRLKRSQTFSGNAYGKEFALKLMAALEDQLDCQLDDRIEQIDSLGLNVVQKGMIDYEGNSRLVATELLSWAGTYGAEDLVPLLRVLLPKIEISEEAIQKVRDDIEKTARWMNDAYGSNL